jgi:glycolate oxidase FAD binding subunit
LLNVASAAGLPADYLGISADAVHGRPDNITALADVLREAVAAGQAVVPWGGGTEQTLGAPPRACDLVLHTDALSGVLAYAPEDLTVAVRAGTSLADLGRELATYGQFLPIDVPQPDVATIGGVVATAATPVRRFRYGGVRDQVIGLEVVLPDGSLAKTGGRVVKNVAGYDLCKLFTGSLGTLGVIASANFKVHPLPRSSVVVHGVFGETEHAVAAGAALAATALGYSAIIMEYQVGQPRCELVILGEGFTGAVQRQAREARQHLQRGGAEVDVLDGTEAVAQEVARLAALRLVSPADGTMLLRGAVAPGRILHVSAILTRLAEQFGLGASLQLDLGVGSFFVRVPEAQDEPLDSFIAAVRQELQQLGGHLIIAAAAARLRRRIDPWAALESSKGLAATIKDRIDPGTCLNPGRFAFGI